MGRRFGPLCLALGALFASASALLLAQGPPPSTIQVLRGTVSGRVLDATTRAPLAGVRVIADDVPAPTRAVQRTLVTITDGEGRFVLRGVPAGRTLRGTKWGYVPGAYGLSTPFGPATPLQFRDGEPLADIEMLLWRAAAISGMAFDGSGEPAGGVTISARAIIGQSSPPCPPPCRISGSSQTDDLGRYFLGGLAPGDYVVSSSDPQTISVGAGEERAGVNVVLPADAALSMPAAVIDAEPGEAGSIIGAITDVRGSPVSGVTVTLEQAATRTTYKTFTGRGNRFEFAQVPAGEFRLSAERPGFIRTEYRARVPGGPGEVIALSRGQRLSVMMTTMRGGVVEGTVRDENGDPMPAMFVSAAPRTPPSLSMRLQSAQTDAQGRFRLFGLAPGDYRVAAAPQGAEFRMQDAAGERGLIYWATYYGNTEIGSRAPFVSVTADSHLSGLDITMRPVPVSSIEVSADVQGPLQEVFVHQFSQDPNQPRIASTFRSLAASSYSLNGTPSGRYLVVMSGDQAPMDARRTLWGTAEVSTDGATPLTLALPLGPGGMVAGRVTFAGAAAAKPELTLLLRPMFTPSGLTVSFGNRGRVEADDSFDIGTVPPGSYVIEATASGWSLKSATVAGRDILDLPIDLASSTTISRIELTMTSVLSEVKGTLSDSSGRPGRATVVVYPADQRYWWRTRRVQFLEVDGAGAYSVRGLPEGEYLVAGVADARHTELQSFLAGLAGVATRLRLSPGESRTLNLVLR